MKTSRSERRAERGQPSRTIYDGHYSLSLPGDVARLEGQPPVRDLAVNEAYDALGTTYGFFWNVYGRDSLDDRGMPLQATVHYGKNYVNAFWNGKAMVIGDGDGQLFNRFSMVTDVMAKELAKGIIAFEADLSYWGEEGALIESVSDVFGCLVKQYLLQQTAEEADWLMGQGLFTASVKAVAIRSLKAPGTAFDDPMLGKDQQPAHMRDFVKTDEDQGGIHFNSGIPNHAFYLAATEIGGFAWEKAGLIWYTALKKKPGKDANFQGWARSTYQTAGELFGEGSTEQGAVRHGWEQVGLSPVSVRRAGKSKPRK